MTKADAKPLTGKKVLFIVCAAFAVIIGANLTLAYQAIATFPGLEVKNSYVASQNFEADRAAQLALDWDVAVVSDGESVRLSVRRDGDIVVPVISYAVLGRATHVAEDQTPAFVFDGKDFVAPIALGPGNWNLRLVAEADNGAIFRQRIVVANRS